MPLDQEFRHHLHELMVETSDKLREELNAHKQKLVWEAQKRNNSAGIPVAYSDAAEYTFRTRVEATIKSYLEALGKCSIVVDAAVEREMLQEIGQLTNGPTSLTLPPGVTGPNVSAVQAEHARRMARAGNALQREAANRLRELKMKASRNVPAVAPMTSPQPFTIASVVPTLAALKALPMPEQAMLLLRRLVQIYPTVRNSDKFHKGNILLPNDNWQVALGFSPSENMAVRQHLLGGPWNRLVVGGYLVDPQGQGFLGSQCRKMEVLYLDYENPDFAVRGRLELMGAKPNPNLKIWGTWLSEQPPQVGSQILLDIANEVHPLMIFDPFRYSHGAEENDSTEMMAVMKSLRS